MNESENSTDDAPRRRGGARPGAGRPRKAKPASTLQAQYQDPRSFLRDVMNDPATTMTRRISAARALLSIDFPRAQPPGKRETAQAQATGSEVGTPWEGLLPRA